MGHYANNCPNPQKEDGYTPYCGKCRKPGHVIEKYRALFLVFPPFERDYFQRKQIQFQQDESNTSRNIHHIVQLTLFKSEDVYITRAATKIK